MYMYATQENSVFVNLYIASNSAVKLGENEIELDQATEYPWEGKVKLTVTPQKPANFALKLRIPGWAEN